MNVTVSEIFRSIQGESTRAGLPCTFVRLAGCNLRCTWCDTTYAWEGGEQMSVEQVLSRVKELGRGRVEVTGGEPLAQPGLDHGTEERGVPHHLAQDGADELLEAHHRQYQ